MRTQANKLTAFGKLVVKALIDQNMSRRPIVMSQITYSQLQELRRLVEEEGYSSASAARQVGVSESSAYYRLRQLGVKLPTRGTDKLAQYGAYDRETDQLVAMGSAREVAAQLGTTEATLRCQVCRGGTRKYQIVKLEEERDMNAVT